MISPACGSIWTPITSTMNNLRPLKRYLASATAAKNESTSAITTVETTTMTLFFTSVQKYGRWIASLKWLSVGFLGIQVGLKLSISSLVLNAVVTIQKTGKTITTKTSRPSVFQPTLCQAGRFTSP